MSGDQDNNDDMAAEQGSDAWRMARVGKLTASRIADALRMTKTGRGADAVNYMAELITERLTGIPTDTITTKDMAWGVEHEGEARNLYAYRRGVTVGEVGFAAHPRLPMAGASPDGIVGNDGMIEIKCPRSKTHIETLLGANIDPDYVKQMQWGMACTGSSWCDFISFDPRFPDHLQMVIRRVPRDASAISDLEAGARRFLDEVHAKTVTLQQMSEAA